MARVFNKKKYIEHCKKNKIKPASWADYIDPKEELVPVDKKLYEDSHGWAVRKEWTKNV